MRTLPIVFTGLLTGLFVALPALAQDAATAEDAAEKPAEPAADKPVEQKPAAPAPAPAATPSVTASAGSAASAASATSSGKSAADENPSARGAVLDAADKVWKLEYHGYLRAPMRVGIGSRDNPGKGQSSTTLHYPVVPDDQYLNWQSTSHQKKDWAEMFFTYGTPSARGVVALQGFNFTDASWTQYNAQFGISQGYVELTPDLGYENFRINVKAGSFWSRYGLAGKWDAGEYDTYLFGRTHVMGESVRVDYDLDDANTLWFEEGLGAKRPDPSQFNNARFTMLAHGHAGLKLGSDMEFTAHMLYSWSQEEDRNIRKENTAPDSTGKLDDIYNPPNYPSTLLGVPDGKMWVAGLDARLELGAAGYFYAGYSHIGASNAISVGPAIEVLHAFGGGQYKLGLTDNYFGPSCQAYTHDDKTNTVPGVPYPNAYSCSMGTGSVNTILAQYNFSLTNAMQIGSGGQKFWGEGTDLTVALYGMLNFVSSDNQQLFGPQNKKLYDGYYKLKYGADLTYQAFPWLTGAVRFDRVQPNNNVPEQSFAILSPRLVFKSHWVTHEQISLQYSRYMYNQRECASGASPATQVSGDGGRGLPAGEFAGHGWTAAQLRCVQPPAAPSSAEAFGSNYENQDAGLRGAPTYRPDVNVFKIEASMWW